MRTLSLEGQIARRVAELPEGTLDMDARTFGLSFASEFPVLRWHWELDEFDEVLLCGEENVDLSRMTPEAAAPLLESHDMRVQIGVIDDAGVDAKARRVRGVARAQRSEKGNQLLTDIADRIRRNVSMAYYIRAVELHEEEGKRPRVVVTRWQPYEVSIVAAGADPTVGIGRSNDGEQYPEEILRALRERKAVNPTPTPEPTPAPRMDIQVTAAREEARKAEQHRIREIQAIGATFKLEREAAKAVEAGTEIESFRTVALDAIEQRQKAPKPLVDLPRSDAKRYSLGRAVQALINGNPNLAPFELEVSRAYADKGVKLNHPERGIYIPMRYLKPTRSDYSLASQVREALGMRAIITKGGEGADLVAQEHLEGEYVPHLLSDLAVVRAGARLLPGLIGDIDIPAGDGSYGVATWAAAETTNAAEIAPAMRTIPGTPKTASGYTDFTRRMRVQGQPALEAIVRTGISDSINELVERTALNGAGASGVPRGIYQVSGVNTVSFAGAPTYAKYISMWTGLKGAKGTSQRLAFITSFAVAGKSMTVTRGGTGSDRMIAEMGADGTFRVDGWPLYPTQESPQTFGSPAEDHGIAFGDWSKLIIASWGDGIELVADPAALALQGGVRIIGFFDADVLTTLNKSFVIATDVDPS